MKIPEEIPSDEQLIYDLLQDMKYAARIVGRCAARIERGEDKVTMIPDGSTHTVYEALEKLCYFMGNRVTQMEGLRSLRMPLASVEGMARSYDPLLQGEMEAPTSNT